MIEKQDASRETPQSSEKNACSSKRITSDCRQTKQSKSLYNPQ